ncbi:MAG: ABC transporter substrate-binding protein [Candidatus Binatia bacterium]
MTSHRVTKLILGIVVLVALFFSQPARSQSLKKVTLAISATNVNYLPFFVALQKGFYRDEGIDLQVIYMPSTLTSKTVLTGDVDYSGAVSGVVGAAVTGQPLKVVMFTVARPLLFLISRKEISEPQQLKGKKIAGSTPGASATLLATQALKHFGLEPGRDVAIMPMGGSAAGRYAILESGVVDASVLSVPENIIAQEKGFRELLFIGDIVELPQTGIGASDKKIRENPDEIYRMIRATLRGILFVWDKQNYEETIGIIMKHWKIKDRKMAEGMFRHLTRVLTKDASVKPESVQVLIDLARENAKVSKPVSVAEVVDFSFTDRARKDLAVTQ